jgi:Domain of unknown function (DUF222)/HNH endonuclease
VCVSGQSPHPAGGFGGTGGFAGMGAALAAAAAGLAFVAGTDAASLPGEELAGCLRALEAVESGLTAARARVLAGFTAQAGYEADGHGTPGTWLAWQTGVTRGAASGAVGWMRRLNAHPLVAAALAAGEISGSWARQVCDWTDLLPPGTRPDADQILLAAVAGGAGLADLSGLAEEMFRRTAPPDPGLGPDGAGSGDDGGFGDRNVQLDVHFRGAGHLTGDLTPECTAALTAVLESLGKKAGPEDDRTKPQRDHDAIEEACRRLIAAGGLPDIAGQPTQIQLHMTLDQLRNLDGAPAAEAAWAARSAAENADAEQAWAAGRATGDDDPGWAATRAAAQAYACDAKITPLVSGHLDPAALAAMTRALQNAQNQNGQDQDGCAPGSCTCPPDGRATPSIAELQDIVLRHAADVLSGPAGLAAALRTGLPGPQAAGVSLPLDIGTATSTIPPHLRRAVTARDRHCAFPGCRQRPQACHVHHLIPRAQGGTTALTNLALACSFHHLIAIHRWGWTLALNGDGTTTATSPDRTRILHSHGPPGTAAA